MGMRRLRWELRMKGVETKNEGDWNDGYDCNDGYNRVG